MSSLIKIDRGELVENGFNNTWKYNFVGSSVNFKDMEIAVQSINLYNSQFNIDAGQYANNTLSIEVPTAATTSTINITLADGVYQYTDINRNIQNALVNAGAYLIDPSGNNVFYIQITANSTYYAAQLDCSATPTTLPTTGGTWTRPSTGLYSAGGSGLPTTTRVPRLIVNNAEFGKVIGFTTGTYPPTSSTTSVSTLSNITPEIHPTSSYVLRCDLVKNIFDPAGNILTSFPRPSETGKIITFQPSQYAWMDTHDGARNSITIQIYDQDDKPVKFRDKSVSIMLMIRKKRS
jgi:hypothetical protein